MNEITRDTSLNNRKLEDHKNFEFEIKEGNETWKGHDLEVTSDPLIDSGTGKPYVIRSFEFSRNPDPKVKLPSKQALFNAHAKQIEHFLWKDGLRPREDISPKVLISKDRKRYKIGVVAEARTGIAFVDKPMNLKDILTITK